MDLSDKVGNMSARTAVVTGSNTGIGFQTAKSLAASGFTVVMACRDEVKAKRAMGELTGPQYMPVVFMQLDTSSFASAKAFAEAFAARFSRLDALVLNAGTGYVQKELRSTEDGNEAILQINYLSHWLITQHLVPLLEATPDSRVVCLSSCEHRDRIETDWDKLNAKTSPSSYSASKLAMTFFAFELAQRHGLITAAANPGGVASDIWRYMDDWKGWYTWAHKKVQEHILLTVEQGAATSIYAATAPLPKGECVYVTPFAAFPLLPYTSDAIGPFNGPTLRKAAPMAYDRGEQQRLWEWSARVCEKWMP